ncbi:MAG: hypothetical protein FWF24_01765 [Alphaproteobacteria bacterium]|nr:hypothetical protein [Alphaproteobacteria bacterium]
MQIIPPPPLPPSASSPMQQQTAVGATLAGHGAQAVAPVTQNAVSASEKSGKSQITEQRKRRQDRNPSSQEPDQDERGERVNISV